eukprot:COSAG06_NODE_1061_length_10874_cov_7.752390_3_plen_158_part_00
MVNYKNGKIYKLKCNITNKVYIGSTAERLLCQRLRYHVKSYNRYILNMNKSHYTTSYDILENGNYTITLLEKCPCESKDELHARERYHIERNECVNKMIPLRTKHEWKRNYCEKVRNYNATYIKRPDVVNRQKEASGYSIVSQHHRKSKETFAELRN